MFKEEGLDDLNTSVHIIREGESAPDLGPEIVHRGTIAPKDGGLSKLGTKSIPGLKPANSSAPPSAFSTLPRAALIVFLIAMVLPGFRYGSDGDGTMAGAEADVIRGAPMVENGSMIEGRDTSPTDTCTRWAHQGML